MNPSTVPTFFSNLQTSEGGKLQPFVQNLNLYIQPDFTNPSQNIPKLLDQISNSNKMSYILAQNEFSSSSVPILKDSGVIAGNSTNATLIPNVVGTQTIFQNQNLISVQASLTNTGVMFAIAIKVNSSAIPTSLQIVQGIDGNGVAALAANISIISRDSLPPVRVMLGNLTESYDIY